ncbi:MAG: GNAT family N-acetyltransferase, partial [Acidimicrobiia bacterium]|nr:GNAT family N-acetyltransferase [Acidimicrobiia bacterium]
HVHGDHDGNRVDAWYRAIEADGELAGFLMVALIDHPDESPFLWRFLVDRRHQRRGVGARALDLLEDHVRDLGETALRTSWVPGRGSPEAFYRARGYVPTGEMDGDEVVGRKEL